MLSPQLRRKVHDLWSLFWSSGLSNPLVAIEQITYLLFLRQLETLDRERVKQGKTSIYKERKEDPKNSDFEKCRWSYLRQNVSFSLLNDTVFPWLRSLETRVGPAQNGNTTLGRISGRLSDAYFILDPNKTDTLTKAIGHIDDLFKALDTRSVNADIMGDIFEYLLEEVKESGKNGQFRTPRHVIRFMVELLDPKPGQTVLDPACGSGGFLLNTLLHWKASHTGSDVLRLEWDGTPHELHPAWPRRLNTDFNACFRGYDNDRTMVRIAWMNLLLHELDSPEIHQLDSLSKRLHNDQSGTYDAILANPPFTGSVDESDLSENRQRVPMAEKGKGALTTKSELLFVWLILDLLKIGGRAAVIVPDGVLFGSTNAHRALRRQLLFENTLEAVVSLPANIFQPYSGVKTSILLFQKSQTPESKPAAGDDPRTREVFFYEINDEAYSLDQRRKARPGQDNDLWDGLIKTRAWTQALAGDLDQRAAAVTKDYHQPAYWEERWRVVDGEFLAIFPDHTTDKDKTHPLQDLFPKDFKFDPKHPQGARQYDQAILKKARPFFLKALGDLVTATVKHAHATPQKLSPEALAEKEVRAVFNELIQKSRKTDSYKLDHEFEQHGINALQTLRKEIVAKIPEWCAAIEAPKKKAAKAPVAPDSQTVATKLMPQLKEFAKLDGYNVWRRSHEIEPVGGKLTTDDEGNPKRIPFTQSWIVPVRQWAERDTWGIDPETGEEIEKPTHHKGIVDPKYITWLADTLNIFNTDATVKDDHLDRLDPDCLEALGFNLSAGRHKPFVFDAGQHRPPGELIIELQEIHKAVQGRLGKLLKMVEMGK
jgi:type I restriction enzyme M protein